MFALVVGFVLGILGSVVAWILVTMLMRPALAVDGAIYVYEDGVTMSPVAYVGRGIQHPGFLGLRGREVYGVNVDVHLHVRGLDSNRGWQITRIPVRNREFFRDQLGFRMRFHLIDAEGRHAFPAPVQDAIDRSTVRLEDLLELGQEAFIRVTITGQHPFSGGMSFATADLTARHLRYEEFPPGSIGRHAPNA